LIDGIHLYSSDQCGIGVPVWISGVHAVHIGDENRPPQPVGVGEEWMGGDGLQDGIAAQNADIVSTVQSSVAVEYGHQAGTRVVMDGRRLRGRVASVWRCRVKCRRR